MMKRGRSCIAAFMACAILLLVTAPAYPSYNTEAGHKYTIACQRLADLRKSPKKKKYRSYWMDCIRTFELVEKKYPKSPSAADACFDRAGIYLELYQFNKYSRDLDDVHTGATENASPPIRNMPRRLKRFIVSSNFPLITKRTAPCIRDLRQACRGLPRQHLDRQGKDAARPFRARNQKRRNRRSRKMPVPVLASRERQNRPAWCKNIRYWSGGAYTPHRDRSEQTGQVSGAGTQKSRPAGL